MITTLVVYCSLAKQPTAKPTISCQTNICLFCYNIKLCTNYWYWAVVKINWKDSELVPADPNSSSCRGQCFFAYKRKVKRWIATCLTYSQESLGFLSPLVVTTAGWGHSHRRWDIMQPAANIRQAVRVVKVSRRLATDRPFSRFRVLWKKGTSLWPS